MVAFDEPADALACADAMLRAVARGDDRMQLRIGIALGEAMRDGDDYFGRPVVVARRLCDSAQPGEVLLCDATSGALAPRAARRLQPRGLLVLKGLRDPVRASALGV
jgi:class 3 adenylate cyclase